MRAAGDTRDACRMLADFADRTDFDNANRGLVARLEPGVIKAAEVFATIAGLTDQPDPMFAVVTP